MTSLSAHDQIRWEGAEIELRKVRVGVRGGGGMQANTNTAHAIILELSLSIATFEPASQWTGHLPSILSSPLRPRQYEKTSQFPPFYFVVVRSVLCVLSECQTHNLCQIKTNPFSEKHINLY